MCKMPKQGDLTVLTDAMRTLGSETVGVVFCKDEPVHNLLNVRTGVLVDQKRANARHDVLGAIVIIHIKSANREQLLHSCRCDTGR